MIDGQRRSVDSVFTCVRSNEFDISIQQLPKLLDSRLVLVIDPFYVNVSDSASSRKREKGEATAISLWQVGRLVRLVLQRVEIVYPQQLTASSREIQ